MRLTRILGGSFLALALLTSVAACSSVTDPDEVGLYYNVGSLDGYEFDHCTKPGQTDDSEGNNEIIYLPTSKRTWTIDDGEAADTKDPIVVSTKPQEGQPAGVQVNVWTQTNFVLNTFCDTNGGIIRTFWESIGRRYKANTEDGWRRMLLENLVPNLRTVTRNVIRDYAADALVGNVGGVQQDAQTKISTQFAAELNRLAGGPFFCGPTFKRDKPDCPPIETTIISIEYNDPGIQQARNEKQKALEQAAANLATAQGQAAALLAEAEGKANAARALEQLYKMPGWVALQKQQVSATAFIEACRAAKECRIIVGSDGQLLLQ